MSEGLKVAARANVKSWTENATWIRVLVPMIVMYLLPQVLSESGLSLISEILILGLAGCAVNMLIGDCSIVSFGHAGFFALGAYVFGLLAYYHLGSFSVSVLGAIFSVTLYSVIVGWFVVRLVEIYFALLCLAFSQVIWVVVSVWYGVTGGDDGLTGIPMIGFLDSIGNQYYFILTVVIMSLGMLYTIRQSSFGRSLHAIRDNRRRAEFIGVNVRRHIHIAFVVSGVFCGIAGILLTILLRGAFPSYAGFMKSGDFLFVCILGGMYNFLGPMVGAFVFILLHYVICSYTEYWPITLGLGIMLIALFFRGGVTGYLIEKYRRVRSKGITRSC